MFDGLEEIYEGVVTCTDVLYCLIFLEFRGIRTYDSVRIKKDIQKVG
jgi:hypothetical protein